MHDREAGRFLVALPDGLDLLPAWLVAEIVDERQRLARRASQGELPPGEAIGDAEMLAYLHTLSRRAPLPSDLIHVFEHLLREVMQRRRPDEPPRPPILSAELTATERDVLRRLKAELAQKRGRPTLSAVSQTESRTRLRLVRVAPKV